MESMKIIQNIVLVSTFIMSAATLIKVTQHEHGPFEVTCRPIWGQLVLMRCKG